MVKAYAEKLIGTSIYMDQVPEPPQLPSPVPGDALTFTSVVFATLTALVIWSLLSLLFTGLFG